MNPTNKLIAFIFASLILFGIGAFIGVKLQKIPEPIHYTAKHDSLAYYQNIIDSLKARKPELVTKVKWLKKTDTVTYIGTDTTCIEIIERKNKLINALDTLCDNLDLEARTYSDKNAILESDNKRFAAVNDSILKHYKDSIKTIEKTHRKQLFWTKTKVVAGTILGLAAGVAAGR